MPPRALRRPAAAAASLRLRAPPPRSAGLKPGPAGRSGAPPRPPPIGCPRSRLPPPGPGLLPPVPARHRGLQPGARYWVSLLGSRAPAVLIGRWGFIHDPHHHRPRTHSRPGGAAATWGVARGWHWDRTPSGPGCVGPALTAARETRSPVGPHVPHKLNFRLHPTGAGGGLRAPGGARVPSRDSAPHSSLRCASACGPGSRESGLQRERSCVASRLGTARLLTSGASPPAAARSHRVLPRSWFSLFSL